MKESNSYSINLIRYIKCSYLCVTYIFLLKLQKLCICILISQKRKNSVRGSERRLQHFNSNKLHLLFPLIFFRFFEWKFCNAENILFFLLINDIAWYLQTNIIKLFEIAH